MFWKKKGPITDAIKGVSPDKRESFRYSFKTDRALEITFKGKKVGVINISSGGISFGNADFRPLDFDHIRLRLDIPHFTGNTSFSAGLRILKIDEDNICHCIFEQCSLEQHELLHKYVLEMQKHDLAH